MATEAASMAASTAAQALQSGKSREKAKASELHNIH